MFDRLLNVLGNSHFEAYVAGPIIGAIVGIALGALARGRTDANPPNATRTPAAVRDELLFKQPERPQQQEVHRHHYHDQKQSDDAFPVFVLIASVLVFIGCLLFAAHLPVIADSLYWLTASVACFAIAATVVSLFGGLFATPVWWWHAVIPVVVSLLCFYIVTIAHASITPEVIHFAQGLLGARPLSLQTLISSGMAFVKGIGMAYVNWMLFEMIAVVVLFVISLISAVQCVYYAALANLLNAAGGFWKRIFLVTAWVDGIGAKIVIWLGLPLAWFLASGRFYWLVSN